MYYGRPDAFQIFLKLKRHLYAAGLLLARVAGQEIPLWAAPLWNAPLFAAMEIILRIRLPGCERARRHFDRARAEGVVDFQVVTG